MFNITLIRAYCASDYKMLLSSLALAVMEVRSFSISKTKLAFEDEYLFKIYARHKDAMKRNLLYLIWKKRGEEDFVKLLVVYILGMILLPNTSCLVPNWLVDFMNDLLLLNRYAWTKATHKWLMDDIPQIPLNIWFYVVMGIGKKWTF